MEMQGDDLLGLGLLKSDPSGRSPIFYSISLRKMDPETDKSDKYIWDNYIKLQSFTYLTSGHLGMISLINHDSRIFQGSVALKSL